MGEYYKDKINKLFEFKKVPGYLAEVNRFGEVIDSITKKEKTLYGTIYKKVGIKHRNTNKWKIQYVHIIVARVFLGKCPKDYEVNHKDLDKQNNYYKNLEYITRSRNLKHRIVYGIIGVCGKGEKNGNAKLNLVRVIDIRFLYSTGLYTMKELAAENNVDRKNIGSIINNKTWKEQ
jgi:hypothetical protein